MLFEFRLDFSKYFVHLVTYSHITILDFDSFVRKKIQYFHKNHNSIGTDLFRSFSSRFA